MTEGFFKARNPAKYRGNPQKIIWRSRWELKYMIYLDSSPEVVEWSSEEIIIPYRSPKDNKIHRYFPDFWVKLNTGHIYIVEIKPFYQTVPPVPKKKKTKSALNEAMTYGVNLAKWAAAEVFCAKKGWQFVKLTEYELNIPGKKNGKRQRS